MIQDAPGRHFPEQPVPDLLLHADFPLEPERLAVARSESSSDAASTANRARLAQSVRAHHAFVWRSLRRLGVPQGDVDDAAQKVFMAVAPKLSDVAPERERAYLFATAVRIAANERRAHGRKRYTAAENIDVFEGEAPSPEQTIADRVLLDKLLHPLPLELRSVFVLFELEQMTKQEIALLLELPEGTVASRLRRARELVEATIARMRAGRRGDP